MGNSKDNFIFTIEALKRQLDYDKTYARTATKLFDAEDMPMYNNGILVQTLVSGLCNYFEDMEEANREICRYMYELDFGRCYGSDIISPEDLYDRIIGDDHDNGKMSAYAYMKSLGWFGEKENHIQMEHLYKYKTKLIRANDINPLGNLYPTNNNKDES